MWPLSKALRIVQGRTRSTYITRRPLGARTAHLQAELIYSVVKLVFFVLIAVHGSAFSATHQILLNHTHNSFYRSP